LLKRGQSLLYLPREALTRRCLADAAPMALEDRGAKPCLDGGDSPADCAMSDTEALRRLGQRTALGSRQYREQSINRG
jgi:hypothetical protein